MIFKNLKYIVNICYIQNIYILLHPKSIVHNKNVCNIYIQKLLYEKKIMVIN